MKKVVPCDVYARVVGYIRPVKSYNKGKEQEWKERKLINTSSLDSTVKTEK